MQNQAHNPIITKEDVFKNLSQGYTHEPDAAKRFEALNEAYRTMAKLLFPEMKTLDAIHALAKLHRPLSVVFGYFSAHHKMGKLGHTKSFTYETLDNLAILKTLCEFWEHETKLDIPEDLQQAYGTLRPNYELSKSKQRLDSKINELMFQQNLVLDKKLLKHRNQIRIFAIICLLSMLIHVVLFLL